VKPCSSSSNRLRLRIGFCTPTHGEDNQVTKCNSVRDAHFVWTKPNRIKVAETFRMDISCSLSTNKLSTCRWASCSKSFSFTDHLVNFLQYSPLQQRIHSGLLNSFNIYFFGNIQIFIFAVLIAAVAANVAYPKPAYPAPAYPAPAYPAPAYPSKSYDYVSSI
jgi:hypothetical protein